MTLVLGGLASPLVTGGLVGRAVSPEVGITTFASTGISNDVDPYQSVGVASDIDPYQSVGVSSDVDPTQSTGVAN